MLFSFPIVAFVMGTALATPCPHKWLAPGPDDVRGPCPMLNTLSNHGYLPRDGKSITKELTVSALHEALNFDATFVERLFQFAISTNPEPNATTYSLEQLRTHNILEHDASLTRADYYDTQDTHTFNWTVYDETRSYWKGPVINVQMAANARLARILTSKAHNPTFAMNPTGETLSFGETSAYIIAFGDREAGTAPKALVEYLFVNERLPVILGWKKPSEPVTAVTLATMNTRIRNATGAAPVDVAKRANLADIHLGVGF